MKQTDTKQGRGRSAKSPRFWSNEVTRLGKALDLEPAVFKFSNPRRIATSLAGSAKASRRRKAPVFQSAMSMLNFYINRAGTNLPKRRRQILERAKDELRKLFGRDRDSHVPSPGLLMR